MKIRTHEGNGEPKLIFVREDRYKKTPRELVDALRTKFGCRFPTDGWRAREMRIARLWHHDEAKDVICELGEARGRGLDALRMHISLYPIYEQAMAFGGLPLHAGLAERKGEGILVTGSSGTGKTTCCRRMPHPWQAVCDDEVFVLPGRGGYGAHPFPTWSEYVWNRSKKVWDVQRQIPISAIFVLRQSKVDALYPLEKEKAVAFINALAAQICRNMWRGLDPSGETAMKKRLFENTCRLAGAVPTFTLHVSRTGRFWKKIEEAVKDAGQCS